MSDFLWEWASVVITVLAVGAMLAGIVALAIGTFAFAAAGNPPLAVLFGVVAFAAATGSVAFARSGV